MPLSPSHNNQAHPPLKGKKRITERFVKYPYPHGIVTNYQKDYLKHGRYRQLSRDEAFNLEKEHKTLNPHEMDFKTTSRVDYLPFSVFPT